MNKENDKNKKKKFKKINEEKSPKLKPIKKPDKHTSGKEKKKLFYPLKLFKNEKETDEKKKLIIEKN